MRQYLATLHQRPHHHKKHFALGVSSGITLTIFAIWLTANFGETAPKQVVANVHEASPWESLGESLGVGWQTIKSGFSGVAQSLDTIDLQSGYEEMKNETLNEYR